MNSSTNRISKLTNSFFLPMLLVLLFILPSISYASSIFNPPATDKSIEYLGMIFGGSLGRINLGLPSESSPFLGNLFQIFNGIILAIAIFILSYVAIISTLNTAQEGEVMGKKWSSVWIPLRSILGLCLLAPVPGSGYSFLQVFIMWVVLNGIGAADKIWDFVLVNLSQGISATQNLEIDLQETNDLIRDGERLGKRILENLTCLQIIKNKTNNKALAAIRAPLKPLFVDEKPTAGPYPGMSARLQFGANDPEHPVRKDLCGHIDLQINLNNEDLTDPNGDVIILSPAQEQQMVMIAYQYKKHALLSMITDISPIAFQIANSKINPTTNQVVFPTFDKGRLRNSVISYQKQMSHLTKGALMVSVGGKGIVRNTKLIRNSERVIRQSKHLGWITAGSFYYLLSQNSKQSLISAAKESPTLNNSPMEAGILTPAIWASASLNITDNEFRPYADAMDDNLVNILELFSAPTDHNVKKLVTPMLPDFIMKSFLKIPVIGSIIKKVSDSLMSGLKVISDYFTTEFNFKHPDPLISQARLGINLMRVAEGTWFIIIIASLTAGGISGMMSFLGTGMLVGLLMSALPIIITFTGIIWGIGAVLGIYTPMVPYMMFVVTALSWFILVIEAIVAAPIVALGLITPAQEELGKIVPALSIIASIFLRPTLMLLGLIFGAKLYKTIIIFVNLGFEFSFTTLQLQTGSSFLANIAILVLYTGFIMTLVNKCYALIYQLPDKVLRWIGATGEQTDASGVKETQQSFEQSHHKIKEIPKGAATSAVKKIREHVDAAIKRDHNLDHNPHNPPGARANPAPPGGRPLPMGGGQPPHPPAGDDFGADGGV